MIPDKYNFKFYVKRLVTLYRDVRQLILSTVCTISFLKLRSHWFDTLNGIVQDGPRKSSPPSILQMSVLLN